MYRSRMAQLFSIDLVFAMLAFSALIGAFLLINSKVTSRIEEASIENSLSADSRRALQTLLTTGGSPSNWTLEENVSRIFSIGMASSRFLVDSGKLARLEELNSSNYSTIKSLLGISKPGYEFELSVKYANGTTAPIAGLRKTDSNKPSSISNSFAVLDGESALISLNLWMNVLEGG